MRYVLFLVSIAFLSACAEGLVESPADDTRQKEQNIVGGIEVDTCGFPSTVSLGGCTGTLIHPSVVLTAEHCGNPQFAEFTDRAGEGFSRGIQCAPVPQTGRAGDDTMFCILDTPVTQIPVTPPLMGCELSEINVGTDVFIVGFGLTAFNQRQSGGIKRWQQTDIVGFESGVALIGTPERSACPGDSGGPVFVRLADGGLRVFGNVSRGTTGIPCNGRGSYPLTHQHIPWFEQTFGIDISPCHDADGTWNPGPDCGGFYAGDNRGNGTWANQCAGSVTSGLSSTCGPAFSQTPTPANQACGSVPSIYVGQNDGCDCPADGSTACDPDCAVSNGAGELCGCDYCYATEAPAPAPAPTVLCGAVPTQYIGVNDGCDCPADGATSCDPDCAISNAGGATCGCDYCY